MEYLIATFFKVENIAIVLASIIVTVIGCIYYSFQPAGFSGYIATGLLSASLITGTLIKLIFKIFMKKSRGSDYK